MRRRLEIMESPHNRVEVWAEDGGIEFVVAGATHATWHPEHLLTGYAWDALTAAVCLGERPPERILLLGLGGGTAVRQLHHLFPEAVFTGVEIDPGMVRLARTHMGLDRLPVEAVCEDAFAFLARRPRPEFDWVIDDLYLAREADVERPARPDADYVARLRAWARPDGGVAMNLVRGTGHRTVQSQARAAMRSGFGAVVGITPPLGLNETLVGRAAPLRARRIRAFADRWPTDHDRARWSDLRANRLR